VQFDKFIDVKLIHSDDFRLTKFVSAEQSRFSIDECEISRVSNAVKPSGTFVKDLHFERLRTFNLFATLSGILHFSHPSVIVLFDKSRITRFFKLILSGTVFGTPAI
jgi:hypothetical protein